MLVRLLALVIAALSLGGCVSMWLPGVPAQSVAESPVPLAPRFGESTTADPRPVVVSGADLGPLLGIDPADLVAVAWHDGRPRAIPVQLDERFAYDVAVVYRGMVPGDCPRESWCRDLDGHVVEVGYADPDTQVGPDPDPTLDALDEVALLAADFGEAPQDGAPPGVDPASGVEIRVEVDGAERFATLWRRTGPVEPPTPRVSYRPEFERGPYLETYDRGGSRPPLIGWPAGIPSGRRGGSNPENSWVQTPHYALAFSDRWIWNRLHVGPPQARGPDLLDVDMIMFAPGICERTPRSGSLSEGGFLVNRSGPVRAIRRAVGFNSGPLAEIEWTFYPRMIESRATLRVHSVPGIMTFLDLSDAARGATYRDSAHPDGVLVDGRPDALAAAPVAWQSVARDGGGWTVAHEVEAVFETRAPQIRTLYQDDATPRMPACMTDRRWIGAHGVWARGPIPNTDPRDGPAGRLVLRRQIAVGTPTKSDRVALQTALVPHVRALSAR